MGSPRRTAQLWTAAAAFHSLTAGAMYSFVAYAGQLQDELNYSQTELNVVICAAFVGANVFNPMIHRILRASARARRAAAWMSFGSGVLGWPLFALAVLRTVSSSPALTAFAMFQVGVSSGLCEAVCGSVTVADERVQEYTRNVRFVHVISGIWVWFVWQFWPVDKSLAGPMFLFSGLTLASGLFFAVATAGLAGAESAAAQSSESTPELVRRQLPEHPVPQANAGTGELQVQRPWTVAQIPSNLQEAGLLKDSDSKDGKHENRASTTVDLGLYFVLAFALSGATVSYCVNASSWTVASELPYDPSGVYLGFWAARTCARVVFMLWSSTSPGSLFRYAFEILGLFCFMASGGVLFLVLRHDGMWLFVGVIAAAFLSSAHPPLITFAWSHGTHRFHFALAFAPMVVGLVVGLLADRASSSGSSVQPMLIVIAATAGLACVVWVLLACRRCCRTGHGNELRQGLLDAERPSAAVAASPAAASAAAADAPDEAAHVNTLMLLMKALADTSRPAMASGAKLVVVFGSSAHDAATVLHPLRWTMFHQLANVLGATTLSAPLTVTHSRAVGQALENLLQPSLVLFNVDPTGPPQLADVLDRALRTVRDPPFRGTLVLTIDDVPLKPLRSVATVLWPRMCAHFEGDGVGPEVRALCQRACAFVGLTPHDTDGVEMLPSQAVAAVADAALHNRLTMQVRSGRGAPAAAAADVKTARAPPPPGAPPAAAGAGAGAPHGFDMSVFHGALNKTKAPPPPAYAAPARAYAIHDLLGFKLLPPKKTKVMVVLIRGHADSAAEAEHPNDSKDAFSTTLLGVESDLYHVNAMCDQWPEFVFAPSNGKATTLSGVEAAVTHAMHADGVTDVLIYRTGHSHPDRGFQLNADEYLTVQHLTEWCAVEHPNRTVTVVSDSCHGKTLSALPTRPAGIGATLQHCSVLSASDNLANETTLRNPDPKVQQFSAGGLLTLAWVKANGLYGSLNLHDIVDKVRRSEFKSDGRRYAQQQPRFTYGTDRPANRYERSNDAASPALLEPCWDVAQLKLRPLRVGPIDFLAVPAPVDAAVAIQVAWQTAFNRPIADDAKQQVRSAPPPPPPPPERKQKMLLNA